MTERGIGLSRQTALLTLYTEVDEGGLMSGNQIIVPVLGF